MAPIRQGQRLTRRSALKVVLSGGQRPYVATTEQVWALHDTVAEHLRPAILLGAFVGLRTAEVVGLRVWDVDFMRGVVRPVQQGNGEPLRARRRGRRSPSRKSWRCSCRLRWRGGVGTTWSPTARAGRPR